MERITVTECLVQEHNTIPLDPARTRRQTARFEFDSTKKLYINYRGWECRKIRRGHRKCSGYKYSELVVVHMDQELSNRRTSRGGIIWGNWRLSDFKKRWIKSCQLKMDIVGLRLLTPSVLSLCFWLFRFLMGVDEFVSVNPLLKSLFAKRVTYFYFTRALCFKCELHDTILSRYAIIAGFMIPIEIPSSNPPPWWICVWSSQIQISRLLDFFFLD